MVPLKKKKEEYKTLKTLKEEIKLHFFSDAPKEWHLQPRLHVAQDWWKSGHLGLTDRKKYPRGITWRETVASHLVSSPLL